MTENCYYYRAKIVSVYDGDTCHADLDLGFGIWKKKETLRLSRINAPEIRGESKEAGRLSRDYLRGLILDKEVMLQTLRDSKGKYGRYIAEIWLQDSVDDSWHNVNDLLVEKGHAIYQEY
ncbi:micrococcal nuclease [Malonomonas rubra DSM 5091]|uniref:Micrococcal nuclease n=1 Tax=Malonomonas rubra DSM 5091 TaxID=1122189 RepID=A0A1M6FCC8_MALRU|nr:thermonuclease family protein [Malonomonas rubra]SHI95322.1 micrococcal nuclease [Malonomonas rubra DSM 5091]